LKAFEVLGSKRICLQWAGWQRRNSWWRWRHPRDVFRSRPDVWWVRRHPGKRKFHHLL